MSGRKNETTEWDDIQIRLGNLAPIHVQKPLTDEQYDQKALRNKGIKENEKEQKLSNASLDELDEFEDEEDEKILAEYRKKRIEEMKQKALKEKFGSLMNISEPEYKKEVTEAPPELWVVVFLTKPGIKGCDIMEATLRTLALKFKATKFVSIRSDDAIRNYPDKNLPTILVYHNSDVIKQFIGLIPFGGEGMTPDDLEWALSQVGAVESELEEDPKKSKKNITRSGPSGYDAWNSSDDDD